MTQRSDGARDRDRDREAMDAEDVVGDTYAAGVVTQTDPEIDTEIDPADLIWIRDVIKARAQGGHYGLPASTLYNLMRRYPELGPYSLLVTGKRRHVRKSVLERLMRPQHHPLRGGTDGPPSSAD